MKVSEEMRTHLRQTLGQMKAEIGTLQQVLENAPDRFKQRYSGYGYENEKDGYELDEYLLKFRLGNVLDLAQHGIGFVAENKSS